MASLGNKLFGVKTGILSSPSILSSILLDRNTKLPRGRIAAAFRLREFRPKVAISVRLNPKVLEWLKSKGSGHLTRINDILANVMEAERSSRGRR